MGFGIGWLLGAFVVCWCAVRGGERSRLPPFVVAAIVFLVPAIWSTVRVPIAQFSLNGYALPYPVDPRSPLLRLAGTDTEVPEGSPVLRIAGVSSATRPVEVFAHRPTAGVSPKLEIRARRSSTLFGLRQRQRETSLFRKVLGSRQHEPESFLNMVRLRGGEKIVVYPGRSTADACPERVLEVRASTDGALQVGPCDLSGEPRIDLGGVPTWSFEDRTVSLLDLYHYDEARCVPKAIPQGAPCWPNRDSQGRLYQPIESFLFLRGQAVHLALLDPRDRVVVSNAEPLPVQVDQSGHRHEIVWLERRSVVPFDELYLEQNLPGHRYWKDGYATDPTARDLSGGRLLKRVKIYFRIHGIAVELGSDSAVLRPLEPQIISIDPSCGDEGNCTIADLKAAYVVGEIAAAGSDTGPLLFPLRLEQGWPLAARLSFTEGCGDGCLRADMPAGRWSYPTGGTISLGSSGRDQHLVRVLIFRTPWWLVLLFGGMFLLQAAVLSQSSMRPTQVVLAGVVVLISARLLFGFKIMARYPNDPEGLSTAFIGAAVLPLGLALAGTSSAKPWGAISATLVLLLGEGAAFAYLVKMGTVSAPSGPTLVMALVFCAACFAAHLRRRAGPPEGLGSARSRVRRRFLSGALSRLRQAEVAFAARWSWALIVGFLSAVVVVRGLLAFAGWERLGNAPVTLWYWPLGIILGGCMLGACAEGNKIRALVSILLILGFCLAQAGWSGDKGAAIVLGPALGLGGWAQMRDRLRRSGRALFLWRSLVATAVAAGCAAYLYVRYLDRSYPPVAAFIEWAVSNPDLAYRCPGGSTGSPRTIDLNRYRTAFLNENIWLRWEDFVLPGVANRVGTRVGAEIHEAIAVLRRYAAGPAGKFFGSGFLSAEIRRYGPAEVSAHLSDGAPSTLLAAEGGTAAVAALLLLHCAVLLSIVSAALDRGSSAVGGTAAGTAFIVVASAAVPTTATFLMLGGNYGVFPFTGQNTPLLSVLSGADLFAAPVLWAVALFFLKNSGR